MDNTFKPTALLVMEHNITGMKYFCKTTLIDRVCRYKGSGLAWMRHLKEHGRDVKVGMLGFYIDEQRCLDAAKKFSEENDIVNSPDWANLVVETGKNGASMKGERNPFFGKKHDSETTERLRLKKIGRSVNKGAYRSPEQRAKISASLKGRKNPKVSIALKGRKLSEITKLKIGLSSKGRVMSEESREKIRQAALAQWAKVKELKQPLPADEGE